MLFYPSILVNKKVSFSKFTFLGLSIIFVQNNKSDVSICRALQPETHLFRDFHSQKPRILDFVPKRSFMIGLYGAELEYILHRDTQGKGKIDPVFKGESDLLSLK